LEGPSPNFSGTQKRKNYKGANGHFLLFYSNYQKAANGDREDYWGYMSHKWFSLMPILVFEGPYQFLQGRAKPAINNSVFLVT